MQIVIFLRCTMYETQKVFGALIQRTPPKCELAAGGPKARTSWRLWGCLRRDEGRRVSGFGCVGGVVGGFRLKLKTGVRILGFWGVGCRGRPEVGRPSCLQHRSLCPPCSLAKPTDAQNPRCAARKRLTSRPRSSALALLLSFFLERTRNPKP